MSYSTHLIQLSRTVLTDEGVGCEERENKNVQVPTVVISDVQFSVHSMSWQAEGPYSKGKTEAGAMASVMFGFGWDAPGECHPGHFPTKHPQSQHPTESHTPQHINFSL